MKNVIRIWNVTKLVVTEKVKEVSHFSANKGTFRYHMTAF